MGRKRKSGGHLPERMYHHKGTYYLVDKDNKWTNLGKSLPKAMAKYHKLVPSQRAIRTMGELIDRYMVEVSPNNAPTTYKSEIAAAKLLRAAFNEMDPRDVTPVTIYEYIDYRSQTAPVRVNREISLLSSIFTKGIRWGALEANPCRDVKKNPERPRQRYVSDEELAAFKSFIPQWLSLYIDLKCLTGLRQTDMLALRFDSFIEEGLLTGMSKTEKRTGKKFLFEWSDQFKATVDKIRGQSGKVKSLYLFSTRQGQPYTADGFRSIWHRWMVKALEEGVLEERFQERDIRKKTASEIDLEHAKLLLGHESVKTTLRNYRLLPTRVKPSK
ncbi:hypothetical protein HMF8227_00309 [Saliniradius amylolyticus]|uniref:Core-binding (CB) domain-containing protein n=1 Tax=Saliniradius amylolyticus TaxID=2183582 RepID=A0A2S2DZK6_9ALTE|nr:tyrosine-type recombinase/integrase [Saliniradius amylolyticus]AWL10816.1 hypothetical protein HMF8227_00309 [Saliniradius amylolyticus]